MPRPNVHLLVIDPQKDFMDDRDSALPVPGANGDMTRLAAMIERLGSNLTDIHVTLDAHRVIDVAHPGLWRGRDGRPPAPFTIISAGDIEAGVWRPQPDGAKPAMLGGQTLGAYKLVYTRELSRHGNYPLMIWPEHCLIGTPGHAMHTGLASSVHAWERATVVNANMITKGINLFTEHYGALMAELPLASDPSTGLNTALLSRLKQADLIAVAGEALSHCVKASIDQIVAHIGDAHIKKLHILTDCTSPIPKVGEGPDFPALSAAWLAGMQARGVTLVASDVFLA